jgi:hypothetical protein
MLVMTKELARRTVAEFEARADEARLARNYREMARCRFLAVWLRELL